jgi:hypothetical protein
MADLKTPMRRLAVSAGDKGLVGEDDGQRAAIVSEEATVTTLRYHCPPNTPAFSLHAA